MRTNVMNVSQWASEYNFRQWLSETFFGTHLHDRSKEEKCDTLSACSTCSLWLIMQNVFRREIVGWYTHIVSYSLPSLF